jgi:mRNA interferase RelE/StbE
LGDFIIAETESFQKKIRTLKHSSLYPKIIDYVYPLLRTNPFYGSNIKKLKGEYQDVYRFRIGSYRLFYKINQDKVIVFIIDIENRKDAY